MRLRACVAVCVAWAMLASCALLTPTALADGGLTLTRASAKFPDRAFTLDVGSEVALDTGDVRLLENGDPVDDLQVVSAQEGGESDFATVLVIDASNSVAGEPIAHFTPGMSALTVYAFSSSDTLGPTLPRARPSRPKRPRREPA